jgi:hypothetical protein
MATAVTSTVSTLQRQRDGITCSTSPPIAYIEEITPPTPLPIVSHLIPEHCAQAESGSEITLPEPLAVKGHLPSMEHLYDRFTKSIRQEPKVLKLLPRRHPDGLVVSSGEGALLVGAATWEASGVGDFPYLATGRRQPPDMKDGNEGGYGERKQRPQRLPQPSRPPPSTKQPQSPGSVDSWQNTP